MRSSVIIFLLLNIVGYGQYSNVEGNEQYPDTIYSFAEIMPQFIGGDLELKHALLKVKLPLYAKQNRVYGRVDTEISIDTNGNVINVNIVKGLGYKCDEEALRIIKGTSGYWISARKWGKKAAVKLPLSIQFKPERDGLNVRAKSFFEKGLKIYQNKNYANALTFFKGATDLSPNYIDAHFYSGNCYFKLKRKPEACAAWSKSIELGIVKNESISLLNYCNKEEITAPSLPKIVSEKLIAKDSILYTKGFKFKDGAYRTYDEFKFNSPSLYYKYRSEVNSEELLLDVKKDSNVVLYSIDENLENKLIRKDVWGYCKDGDVYVLSNNGIPPFEFFTLDIVGGIMLISNDIKVYKGGVSAAAAFNASGSVATGVTVQTGHTTKRVKLKMIDYDTGKVQAYNVGNVVEVLKKDEQLYRNFSMLKGAQKKNMLFIYLKKFNDNYHFYIMLNSYKTD